ncbi:zinc finger protein OZF-like isoform X1 [Wyeomyia smithii]|uniref:zinc finger protein OZF-like isoform X1 n=1 Tax=Wyeomyia smithii TaxID=174621 RepID=UPI002467C03A|nr:zinc finger protein OZF-like isoform X1 [Wyeomyia smithii]XP_055524168.1 zinc finger protein OZF-like isoform X1 [Wyeomyia smithii]
MVLKTTVLVVKSVVYATLFRLINTPKPDRTDRKLRTIKGEGNNEIHQNSEINTMKHVEANFQRVIIGSTSSSSHKNKKYNNNDDSFTSLKTVQFYFFHFTWFTVKNKMNISQINEDSKSCEEESFIKVEETRLNEPVDQPNNIHPDLSIDENKPYDCKISGVQQKANHHSGKKSLDCNECGKKFPYRSSLIEHKLTHSDNDGSFGCDICNKKFKEEEILTRHLKKHEKNVECDVCGKRFLYPCQLKQHAQIHFDEPTERKIICEICGKAFTTRYNRNVHLKGHKKPFTCNKCSKTFLNYKSLCAHKPVHSDKQAYKCEICGESYQKSYLKIHMRMHAGNQRFKCEVCGKILSSANTLEIHTRFHRGEEPYKCEICDLSCASNSSLKRHLRTHTKEDPFGCDICGKRFAAKCSLKYHMAVHKNSRPHQCSICGKGFITATRLLVHTRMHTGERPYKCCNCDKSYSSTRSLKCHLMNAHSSGNDIATTKSSNE